MTKKPREISWGKAASIAIGALLDMEARRKNRVEREAAASTDQDSVSRDLHEAVVLELSSIRAQLHEARRERDRARRCLREHTEDCGESECQEEIQAALGLADEVPTSLSEWVVASISSEQLPKYVAAARAYDEATHGRYAFHHSDGYHDAGIKAAVDSFAAELQAELQWVKGTIAGHKGAVDYFRSRLNETMDALRAATENIGILEGVRDRLRQRVHEAVDECQRRYAKTESDLAKLRHFMRESLRLHGEEMKRLGKSPHHNISGYGQATFAMFLRELEALNLVVAAAESWRDRLSGQVLADYELPLRDAVDLHRAWRKEDL